MALTVDPREVAARELRPARPRFAEALSVVTGLPPAEALAAWERTLALRARGLRVDDPWARRPRGLRDPAEAWEALAARGVIPRAWAERDPARHRVWCQCRACGGTTRPSVRARCAACKGAGGATGDGAAPPTIHGCLTLASDPEGVARAEALAREASARLGARCGADPTIAWQVCWPTAAYAWGGAADGPLNRAAAALNARHAGHHHLAPVGEHPRYTEPMRALRAVCDAGGSHHAGTEVFGLTEWAGEGANPFEPMVAVRLTGYALADASDAGVTLVALSV